MVGGSQINSPYWARLRPGLDVLSLATPTLPPATTTNTVLIGAEVLWVVDPGTPHQAEREKLLGAIRQAVEGGCGDIGGIVLTHHHRDHVGAAGWLREQLAVPICAHECTRELLGETLDVDMVLVDGGSLEADSDGWSVLHTPGHASGHVVLWHAHSRVLIAGDMVTSEGTVVIDPPDGCMVSYMAQLSRLIDLEPGLVVPAHGQPVSDGKRLLEFYLAHRLERESKIIDGLRARPTPLQELTQHAYDDVPEFLHGLARRSALAHLIKLREEGKVEEGPGSSWRIAPAAD